MAEDPDPYPLPRLEAARVVLLCHEQSLAGGSGPWAFLVAQSIAADSTGTTYGP